MTTLKHRQFHLKKLQAGIVLLEGLIAILIFSIGVLAVVGLQAVAVKQVSDANYRSEASMLANELIGTMRVSVSSAPNANALLQASFDSDDEGESYVAWSSKVTQTLPGASANPPTVEVGLDGVVQITLRWLAPSDEPGATPHRYVTVAQIRPN